VRSDPARLFGKKDFAEIGHKLFELFLAGAFHVDDVGGNFLAVLDRRMDDGVEHEAGSSPGR